MLLKKYQKQKGFFVTYMAIDFSYNIIRNVKLILKIYKVLISKKSTTQ